MLLGARQFFERRGAPTPPLPYDAEVEYLQSTGTQYLYIPLGGTNRVSSFDFALRHRFTAIPTSGYYGSGYTTSLVKQFFYALSYNSNNGLYMCFNGSTDIARNLSANKTIWHDISASTNEGRVVYSFDGADVANYLMVPFTLENIALFVCANNVGTLSGNIGMQQISSCRLSVNGVAVFDFIPVRFTNSNGQPEGAMYDRVSGALFRNAGTGAFLWAEKQ